MIEKSYNGLFWPRETYIQYNAVSCEKVRSYPRISSWRARLVSKKWHRWKYENYWRRRKENIYWNDEMIWRNLSVMKKRRESNPYIVCLSVADEKRKCYRRESCAAYMASSGSWLAGWCCACVFLWEMTGPRETACSFWAAERKSRRQRSCSVQRGGGGGREKHRERERREMASREMTASCGRRLWERFWQ